jgi:hypothetical protein
MTFLTFAVDVLGCWCLPDSLDKSQKQRVTGICFWAEVIGTYGGGPEGNEPQVSTVFKWLMPN